MGTANPRTYSFRKQIVTVKKRRLLQLMFLMRLAALSEYSPAASGGTEAQSASFRVRERS